MNPSNLDEALTAMALPDIQAKVQKLNEEMQRLNLQVQTWNMILQYRMQLEALEAQKLSTATSPAVVSTNGSMPTLREGILTILREAQRSLTAQEIRADLERRGWLPEGAYGDSRVYGMLSGMFKKHQLTRPEPRKYELPHTGS